MVAILYTQGVRLKTLGLLARCMFLDGPGAKNDFYIFKSLGKIRIIFYDMQKYMKLKF